MAPSSRWSIRLFFLWILLIHTAGLYLFTKGFLLSRQILDSKSHCSDPPVNLSRITTPTSDTSNTTCWTQPIFSKAIILLIDALRHDFTTPQPTSPKPYHNALTVLHETASQNPHNALLLPFIADPPTTTLQRLKALTTGTLPTFIEAGSNFAGSAITEDNLITQLRDAGKHLVHLGDDTWGKLFPEHFDPRLSRPYDSFLVEDLHTVDDRIYEHLLPLVRDKAETWDVVIAHFLGVDHVGHRFGPAHHEMQGKLYQMDRIVREVMREVDDETVLVVMGDHGMDENGNHGGETRDEVRAALWLYTTREVWGVVGSGGGLVPVTGLVERDTPQVDVVATLALLLGVPIPFNNLGRPIEEVFVGVEGRDWGRLVEVSALAAAQVQRFAGEYENRGGEGLGLEGEVWEEVEVDWEDEVALRELYEKMRGYQSRMLEGYRRVWAQFDLLSMVEGVMVLLLGVGVLLCFQVDAGRAWRLGISGVVVGIVTGVVAGVGHVALADSVRATMEGVILGAAVGSAVPYIWRIGFGGCSQLKVWDWQAVMFTLLLSIGFASNSYTVWEDRVVLVFLSTFGICTLGESQRQYATGIRGAHSLLFMLLNRVASLSQACREEQLPFCSTSFYRLENNAVWRLSIPVIILMAVLYTTRTALEDLEVRNVFWFKVCMPVALLCNAAFWSLETAHEQGWLGGILAEDTSKVVRMTVARTVLVIVLVGLGAAFTSTSGQRLMERRLIFTTAVLLVSILAGNPTGGLSLTILYCQLISLRHLVCNSSIKPTIAALLGTLHFFSTGHNATFSSIQWKTAYIPFRDPQYPLSPLLVIINTFAAPIVAACAVPLYSQDQSQARLLAAHSTVYTVWAVSTAAWACILRRHLMLFAIFCPRFLMAGGLMVIVDVLALLSSY
ncbi:GPI ethanolamine phosphate transferase 3 [Aspergillus ibericus CBS 121593]|uniref:GPI ethanolamine phosphate transferase 3 n=1 Tax=Aspergillus ibericus CBS 121593 TaxID=1448316 RepID=A0A395GQH1_9EURO|nr:GPI ethanolamine phosphate transferase 3 [Aspergillus ibericus CBS 121593]RAK97602.1 GPI ethanolamine phosphate transferase 3 [Aspergillus ibericus CBS 121593]